MKRLLLPLLLCTALLVRAQTAGHGRLAIERFNAPSLQNSGGEDPVRRITVYLPPGYDETKGRYPVIYYLHGFLWSDSLLVTSDHIDRVLDKAITLGRIRPVIVVMPNERTRYGGSFYTNSPLTGNWSDFTANDLVQFIDAHYRTIPDRASRGISGHSMGGHGALKMGMLHPNVFSSVYAFSPGFLAMTKEAGIGSGAFYRIAKAKTPEEVLRDPMMELVVDIGRTYSPNPARPPFYCDLPFTYIGDSLVIDSRVQALWDANTPFFMTGPYADSLRRLTALKLDWGRNDEFTHIPPTCRAFSERLENLAVPHYAEEYIGTHGSKILSDDGRMLNEMLPFFDRYLRFEELPVRKK